MVATYFKHISNHQAVFQCLPSFIHVAGVAQIFDASWGDLDFPEDGSTEETQSFFLGRRFLCFFSGSN